MRARAWSGFTRRDVRTIWRLAAIGWEYRLLGAPDPIVTANLRWLGGYRHPRHDRPAVAEVSRRVLATPTQLMARR